MIGTTKVFAIVSCISCQIIMVVSWHGYNKSTLNQHHHLDSNNKHPNPPKKDYDHQEMLKILTGMSSTSATTSDSTSDNENSNLKYYFITVSFNLWKWHFLRQIYRFS